MEAYQSRETLLQSINELPSDWLRRDTGGIYLQVRLVRPHID